MLATLAAGAIDCIVVIDEDGRIAEWNPAAERTFGISREQALGEDLADLVIPADKREAHRTGLRRLRDGAEARMIDRRIEVEAERASGERFPAELTITRLPLEGRTMFSGSLRDLTEQRRAATRSQQLRAVIGQGRVILFATDRKGTITLVEGNDGDGGAGAVPDVLGHELADVFADAPGVLEAFAQALTGGTSAVDVAFGRQVWQTSFSAMRDGEDGAITGVIGVATDVTADRVQQHAAAQRAALDPLTGAMSRSALERLLIGSAPGAAGVLHVGIDNFDLINASLGRAAGDELLRQAFLRLREALGDGTTIARPGGHHFTVVLPDATERDAIVVADAALEGLRPYYALDGAHFAAEASVGIAVGTIGRADPDELVRRSERAFARATATRPGGWMLYEPSDVDPRERLRMTARLREAIELGHLRLLYQPIFRLHTNAPEAVEALVRWDDPDEGLISPATFIPLAEVTGLIDQIGEWVTGELCRQAVGWRQVGVAPQLHFNASPAELRRPGYAQQLIERVDAHDLPCSQFTIEVTESAAMEQPDHTWPALEELRAAGVRIAIDDFGAGHSSLARLRELPVETLKIDRQFLHGVPKDRDAAGLMRSILGVADALRLTVVAEGIETDAQLDFLIRHRCELGQGFLLTRPASATGLHVLGGRPARAA